MATYTFTPNNPAGNGKIFTSINSADAWNDVHNAATGTVALPYAGALSLSIVLNHNVYVGGSSGPAEYGYISRMYFIFDTASTIPDDETILGARIKLYLVPSWSLYDDPTKSITVGLVAADFVNDNTVVAADFNDFGNDLLSNEITMTKSDAVQKGWGVFELNATGLTKIAKAAGTYTVFGLRISYDIEDVKPPYDIGYSMGVIGMGYPVAPYNNSTPTLEVDYPGPDLKVYNGSEWVLAHLKRYSGSTWEDAVLKYYDGSNFTEINASGASLI